MEAARGDLRGGGVSGGAGSAASEAAVATGTEVELRRVAMDCGAAAATPA